MADKTLVKTIKKEKYTAKIYSLENCVTEIECEIQPEYYIEQQNKELKKISKDISVPGFRKGKAPGSIVQQKFQETLLKQTDDVLANQCFNEIASEEKFKFIAAQPRIQFKRDSDSKKISLALFFEERPNIDDIDLDLITIEAPKQKTITPSEVDDTINQIKLLYATWNDITGPVFQNEICNIDISIKENGKSKTISSNLTIAILPKNQNAAYPDWLIDGLKGMKVQESKEMKPPGDDAEGKTIEVKLNRLQGASLPKEDTEFFNKLGVKSATQLRNMVKTLLEEQADETFKLDIALAYARAIHKQSPFDLPLSMVNAEVENRFKNLMHTDIGKEFLEHGLQTKEYIKTIQDNVISFLSEFFIFAKIFEQNKLELDSPKVTKNAITETLMIVQGKNKQSPDSQYFKDLVYTVSIFLSKKIAKK